MSETSSMLELEPPATMLLTYKYRLNPDKRQHAALKRILEQQRQLYNAALEERMLAYRMAGKSISEVEQSRSLTVIRADDPDFAGVQRRIQRETLRRLDRAYKAFFRRARQGAGTSAGFPQFKGWERFDGFGFDAFQQIAFDGGGLRFAGMPGRLRVYVDRPLPQVIDAETGELVTRIKGVWFKAEDRCGDHISRWHVGFQVEVARAPQRARGKTVGVDWGTSVLAALSTGEMIANPRNGEAAARALRRAQRRVARGRKGSKRRMKARRVKRALERKTANRRRNHLDKISKRLVTHYRAIAIETFPIKDLMNAERVGEALPQFVKTRRNREILDTAPFLLRQMTTYKALLHGARQIAIDPTTVVNDGNAAQPTQRCSMCGKLHFKEMTEEHICRSPGVFFGMPLPRKVNAARVIEQLAFGDLALVAEDRGGPVPGGATQVANGGNSRRRLGKTEGEQSPPGRRSVTELPSRMHGQAPRPPPGRLRTKPS